MIPYSIYSDSDDSDEVRQVRVYDKGSKPHCANVNIQGVLMSGVVDSGADITIMGGEMFKLVAVVAKLKKRDFKPPITLPVITISSLSASMVALSLTLVSVIRP